MIHGYWLREYGIAGSYEAVDVAPADFETFLAGLRQNGFVGGNVTIPHKEAAFGLAGVLTRDAEEIGAVNTLWLEDGILHGTNTDAYGFLANLDQTSPGWDGGGSAAVLGAGGAARAIVFALRQRGFRDIRILNRTQHRARDLAQRFGDGVSAHSLAAASECLGDISLVVNTTSVGMHGDDALPVEPQLIGSAALVTDIVYVPLETPFLAAARRCGLKTADGLGMLLHQAVPGFERWFGRRPEVTARLRRLVVDDIERRR